MTFRRHTIIVGVTVSIIASGFIFKDIQANRLLVAFISQAPAGNWSQPWLDACEETSIITVDSFYQGETLLTTAEAKEKILTIMSVKNQKYGKSNDENADKIVDIIHHFFTWDARVVINPTLEQLKKELDEGHPIILPAHGKSLQNKYFKNGGPHYHVFVLSGYDDDTQEFIAKEPGTSFGDEYRYSYATVMDAMHDFLPNAQTKKGRKVAIFTSPHVSTAHDGSDGDKDGLSKADEISMMTSLLMSDTDRDGYSDGTEVNTGFLPLRNEKTIPVGTLITSSDSVEVYRILANKKKQLVDEQEFAIEMPPITVVSQKFIEMLK